MKNCCQTKCKISSVAIEYDAMGREKSVADAKGVTAFAYDAYGALASETVSGLYSKILLHHRDTFGRDVGFTLDNSRKNIIEYSEDTGRLYRMKAGGAWFTWEYLAGTDLKSKLTYGASGNTTWEYEPQRDLLTRVRNFINGGVISQYDYANDALGRRTEMTRSGSMMVATGADAYGYNTRDELISSATGGAVQYAYQYDDIGNRITSSDLGANRIYSANELNQYTNILCNASPTLFNPAYDLDGNQTNILTSTGVWSVTYNGENRPVNWQCGATNIVMQFDRMGRRVECLETVGGATNRHERFVYNGYLCVQELNAANANAVAAQFVWDPTEKVATRPLFIYDMGASDNGTCGISGRVNGGYMFVTCDGNKNVSDVVHFSRAARIAAHYEYAPFGAVTAATTTSTITPRIVSANPFRFSSEYHDDTLGLVYYNYRHYNPKDGRWLGRDSIGEHGGEDLYGFVRNAVLHYVDVLGLFLGSANWFTKKGHTHEELLNAAYPFTDATSTNCLCLATKKDSILRVLLYANLRTDKDEDKKDKQYYHFCTGLESVNTNFNGTWDYEGYKNKYLETMKALGEELENNITTPNSLNCKTALERLGTLTHMWQDYYAHGVAEDDWFNSDEGLIFGDPYSPGMIPVSFGYAGFRGGHGGFFRLLNPFSNVEPGDRAENSETRRLLANSFVRKQLEKFLPQWACHCCELLED